MAKSYITEKSFIARLNVVNTQYTGPVGRWEYSPGYNGNTFWRASEWLTTSRQDREPLTLWFGAVQQAGGEDAYEIRLWTGNNAHPLFNRRVDVSTNGYLGLYEHKATVGPLWRLQQVGGSQVRITTLDDKAIGIYWDRATWTTGRMASYLCVDVVPAAVFEVEIIRMGVDAPL
ncbi:hypothetical protein [Pseudomonas urmiensis]|uniref:hypothetical protein n=1 Tax=Pseudomonas urmiensis TaxID=2745493 RepID=UPI003D09CBD7